MLQILTGEEAGELPREGYPLYNHMSRDAFVRRMPRFNQWGLLPAGHEGPQDNPFLVAPEQEGSMGATSLAATAGGDDNPSPRAAQRRTSVSSCGGGVAPPGGGATSFGMMDSVRSPKMAIPGPPDPAGRARPEGGSGALPKALKKRKWVALDE